MTACEIRLSDALLACMGPVVLGKAKEWNLIPVVCPRGAVLSVLTGRSHQGNLC